MADETNKPESSLPIGAEVRVARLNSLVAVRAELGRLYREARRRHGRYPDAITAQRLATILGSVSSSIELVEIEQRLKRLEDSSVTGRSMTPDSQLAEHTSAALRARGH